MDTRLGRARSCDVRQVDSQCLYGPWSIPVHRCYCSLPFAPMSSPWFGPIVTQVIGAVAGGIAAGVPGAVGGLLMALGLVGAIGAGAAVWVDRIGRLIEPSDAWETAPRPPLFTPMCEAIYRRVLASPDQ